MNQNGYSALHGAVLSGNTALVQMLLERKMKPNHASFDKQTALHLACFKGNKAMVEILLAHGADCNIRSVAGSTPLLVACNSNHPDLIPLLLDKTILSINELKYVHKMHSKSLTTVPSSHVTLCKQLGISAVTSVVNEKRTPTPSLPQARNDTLEAATDNEQTSIETPSPPSQL